MFLTSAEQEPRSKEEQRYHQHPNETEKFLLTVEYLERCNMKVRTRKTNSAYILIRESCACVILTC